MRLIMALVAVAALMAFVASTASAGEITGNGRLITVHGNSPCAYSGQEDLQWYTDNSDTTLRSDPTRGDPAYAQNWGKVKQATGLTGGANSVPAAEWGRQAAWKGTIRAPAARGGESAVGLRPPTGVSSQAPVSTSRVISLAPLYERFTPCRGRLVQGRARR